jgi:hypothetical protein
MDRMKKMTPHEEGGGETFYEKTIFVVVKKYRVVT